MGIGVVAARRRDEETGERGGECGCGARRRTVGVRRGVVERGGEVRVRVWRAREWAGARVRVGGGAGAWGGFGGDSWRSHGRWSMASGGKTNGRSRRGESTMQDDDLRYEGPATSGDRTIGNNT
ncbi:Os08g0422950 [Oryza sativa Japonica Group]|uniref:Os08g0422950 protein n=1 Tax=Oryza sativa subsp. japonica TaxID=39947 RepID=A0A0P0XFW1_ORYSJ|nr:Os08g0422950 [Oryza sativa Japonica Group]